MEPASSSDDESASHSSSYASSSSDDEKLTAVPALKSLDDLPSDDSCADELLSDSDDGENDSGDEEDMTLEQRVVKKRYSGKEMDKEKLAKSRKIALEKARARVKSKISATAAASMKSKKMNKNKDNGGFFVDSDDELSVNATSNVTEGNDTTKTTKSSDLGNDKDKKRKKSKHAPTEVSSKRKDFFERGAPNQQNSGLACIGSGVYKPRDPRMQSLSGYFDQNLFDSSYGFLEDMQDKEIDELRSRIEARKATGKIGHRKRRKFGVESDAHALEVRTSEGN